MLINLRNALMAGKRLPYDAEVEFLESTGTQWIDTGTPIAYNYHIELTFATTASGTQYIFGDSISGSSLYRWAQTSANKFAIMTGNGSTIGTPPSISTNTFYTARVENKNCYLNDVQFATIAGSDPSTPRTAHAYLFTWNAATITGGKVQIYSCKIWDENGVLVRDFIPVRKGTVGYLYDRVSGALFGNAGTGDFVVGPDVVPVEYIESFRGSEGGQYINTDILATTSTKWEIDLAFTTTTTGQLMGSGYAGYQRFNIGIESNAFRGGFGGGWFTISNTRDTNRHLWRLESLSATQCEASIDGGAAVSNTSTFSPYPGPILLGKRYASESMTNGARYYANKIWTSGDLVQNLLPVRVGTDATSWEGAMMDVLTRRIYRNQGTGAFAYGNDLKYPIPAS